MKGVLVALAFVAVAVAYCPNGCSPPNGECSAAEVCQCFADWAGDDCSISDVGLQNHVAVDGRVETRQWRFYHFLARSQQSSVEFQVNQTGTGGDIDVYVRLDSYPNRQEFDLRDISTSKKMKFEIQSPHGVYYLGVYGFLGSDFSVMATLKTSCPNDCSGHGTCNFNGVCTCRDGFVGTDCSQAIDTLSQGTPVSSNVLAREWKYYRLLNSENTIQLTLDVGAEQDADLYVKFNQVPTLTNFDFRDTGVSASSNLRISGAQRGTYYVGVYGFSESTDFTLSAQTFSECPNQCSGTSHGSCSDTFQCLCAPGYAGETCETRNEPILLDGTAYGGHVGGNLWNYYRFNTFTTSNVGLTLRQLNENADCDLYVKQGQNPTRFSFDYRDISYNSVVNVTIENPAVNTWYVGVFGYKECSYELSGLITQRCPNDCVDENHGVCVAGHCVCKDDWTSEDCSLKSTLLSNGEPKSGSIATGSWEYFRFRAVPGTRVTIALKETRSVGNIWLFESAAGNPTLSLFDHAETETNSNIHRVVTRVDENAEINIGVYGSILASPGVNYDFQLVAWQARFD